MSLPVHRTVETFRVALIDQLGLRLGDDKLPLLQKILGARMRAAGTSDAEAYFLRLRHTRAERDELACLLAVGETYFLRDPNQLNAFGALVRERAAAGKRRLRVLSAGCASGEEAYSIGIVFRETLADLEAWDLTITAIDINPDAIKKATSGRYSDWSLRAMPRDIKARYFRSSNREHSVDDRLRERVRFERRDLFMEDPGFWRPDSFDVVFCRNVLMYFTPEFCRQAVVNIARALVPGGFLFLGAAENLRGISQDFHLCHAEGAFYYQRRSRLKPKGTVAPIVPQAQQPMAPLDDDASWVEAISRSWSRIAALMDEQTTGRRSASGVSPVSVPPPGAAPDSRAAGLAEVTELMRQERFRDALGVLAGLPRRNGEDPGALLLEAVLLLGSGDLSAAEKTCGRLLEIDELHPGAHYVIALCRESSGDRPGAVEHNQVAAYLDPSFAMPHVHLGLISRRGGDAETARRELELAASLLEEQDDASIDLFGGGFGRAALIDLCRAELEACRGRA